MGANGEGDGLAGDAATFSLDAKYYSGGDLGNVNADWFLEATPYYFQPSDKYARFNFMDWDRDEYWEPQKSGQNGTLAQGKALPMPEGISR